MEWASAFGQAIPAVLTLINYKLYFGQKAKRTEYLDRLIKEVALRDALLRLQIAATEEESGERYAAKRRANEEARRLSDELILQHKTQDPNPIDDMFRRESFRARMMPEKYEGLRLDPAAQRSWRKYMRRYRVAISLYISGSLSFLLPFLFHGLWPHLFAYTLLYLILLLALAFGSASWRRKAYKIAVES